MKLKTIKEHRYAGKLRKIGDEYEVKQAGDIRVILALGWAKECAVVAAPAQVVEPAPYTGPSPERTFYYGKPAEEPKPKRQYKRRVMTDYNTTDQSGTDE